MVNLDIKLNEGQLDKLADFSANLGVVQFAIVVTTIFSNTGINNYFMLVTSFAVRLNTHSVIPAKAGIYINNYLYGFRVKHGMTKVRNSC